MNQINPLHVGVLLVAILAFIFFNLGGLRTELAEANLGYKESEKLAVELSSLKDAYADKKKTRQTLNRILAQQSLKAADLEIRQDKSSIKVSSKSIDLPALNSLMSKALNGSYNITGLKIKKLSETKASLQMEIKW